MERVVIEIDAWEARGRREQAYQLPEHGLLTSDPTLLAAVTDLIGPSFVWHHIHSYLHRADDEGVAWHSDYNQVPQSDRRFTELIALIYPRGLHSGVGSLVVVPGTHCNVSDWSSFAFLGTAHLPGEVVINTLPPGSVVFAHTSLVHCRRPVAGVGLASIASDGVRYFCDTSYCQAGTRWASYDHAWWREMLRECRERGYDRNGSCAWLYDESRFYDHLNARRTLAEVDHALLSELLPQARRIVPHDGNLGPPSAHASG